MPEHSLTRSKLTRSKRTRSTEHLADASGRRFAAAAQRISRSSSRPLLNNHRVPTTTSTSPAITSPERSAMTNSTEATPGMPKWADPAETIHSYPEKSYDPQDEVSDEYLYIRDVVVGAYKISFTQEGLLHDSGRVGMQGLGVDVESNGTPAETSLDKAEEFAHALLAAIAKVRALS